MHPENCWMLDKYFKLLFLYSLFCRNWAVACSARRARNGCWSCWWRCSCSSTSCGSGTTWTSRGCRTSTTSRMKTWRRSAWVGLVRNHLSMFCSIPENGLCLYDITLGFFSMLAFYFFELVSMLAQKCRCYHAITSYCLSKDTATTWSAQVLGCNILPLIVVIFNYSNNLITGSCITLKGTMLNLPNINKAPFTHYPKHLQSLPRRGYPANPIVSSLGKAEKRRWWYWGRVLFLVITALISWNPNVQLDTEMALKLGNSKVLQNIRRIPALSPVRSSWTSSVQLVHELLRTSKTS